jgi:hypothetical protein
VMEYYAEVIAKGGIHLLPAVLDHLRRCPHCEAEHSQALRLLLATRSGSDARPRREMTESGDSSVPE